MRSRRVAASTIGIISIGWSYFRLILVSRAPTYCNHADILCSRNARSSPGISPHATLSTNPPPSTLFWSLSSRSSISPDLYPRRSMLSYPTDNSIILHAKTASDVLAQSASHLCEQITSYRKTDFIFEEERWSWFFFFILLDPPLPARSLVLWSFLLYFFSFSFPLYHVQ